MAAGVERVRTAVEPEAVDDVRASATPGHLSVEHHHPRTTAAYETGGGETGEAGADDDHVHAPVGALSGWDLLISGDIHAHPTIEAPRM